VNGAPMLYLPPFYPLFDPATKWLGQGKAFEYAQQNVNLDRVSRRPQAPARKVFVSSQGVDLGGSACKRFRHARPRPSSGCLSPFVMPAGRKTRPFTSLREYPRISSRNRRKLDCARKTGFHFAANRKEKSPHVRPPEA